MAALAVWVGIGLVVVVAAVALAVAAYRRRPHVMARNAIRHIDGIADGAMADMARYVAMHPPRSPGRTFADWLD